MSQRIRRVDYISLDFQPGMLQVSADCSVTAIAIPTSGTISLSFIGETENYELEVMSFSLYAPEPAK